MYVLVYRPCSSLLCISLKVVDFSSPPKVTFEDFCNSLSWEDHATALAATLVVPANASKMCFPVLDNPSNRLSDDEKQQLFTLRPLNGSSASLTSKYPRGTPSYGASPFPTLDAFIVNTLGRRKGLVGSIGTWSLGTQQPLPQTICYNMKDNRYCDNAGRAHKSNNVIWNVHLIDRVCYQSCHDPDCRGFRGKPIDLPEEVNLEIEEYFLDYELSSLNENEAIQNKANEQTENAGEFDDPSLDAAMSQLDMSCLPREKRAAPASNDQALDDFMAKLSLSDNVPINSLTSNESKQSEGGATISKVESKPSNPTNEINEHEPWEQDGMGLKLGCLTLEGMTSFINSTRTKFQ